MWEGTLLELAVLLIFGLALSLDGFGAGLAYGLRRIRVPVSSLVIISGVSAAAVSLSLVCGHLAAGILNPRLAQFVGGWLLIGLGVWILTQALRTATRRMLRIRIPPLGLVIQVLFEPLQADLDASGCISAREAVLLGSALAMDAFGGGFAIALSGLNTTFLPVYVFAGLFMMVSLGLLLGRRAVSSVGHRVNLLPGCLLIAIGMLRIVKGVYH